MKLRIETTFEDKYTGATYHAGSEVDFDEARAKELLADGRGLVSKAPEDEGEAVKAEPEDVAEDITEKEAEKAPEEPKKATKAPAAKKPAAKKKK